MSVDPRLPTPSEFVACKLRQGSKYEFRAGAIYAMAGATDDHIQTVQPRLRRAAARRRLEACKPRLHRRALRPRVTGALDTARRRDWTPAARIRNGSFGRFHARLFGRR